MSEDTTGLFDEMEELTEHQGALTRAGNVRFKGNVIANDDNDDDCDVDIYVFVVDDDDEDEEEEEEKVKVETIFANNICD